MLGDFEGLVEVLGDNFSKSKAVGINFNATKSRQGSETEENIIGSKLLFLEI